MMASFRQSTILLFFLIHQTQSFSLNLPTKKITHLHSAFVDGSEFGGHYYLIEGLVTGFTLTLATGASRIVSAQEAWEGRLRDSSEDETELDSMASIAALAPSKYGPQAERRRETRGEYDEEREARDFAEEFGIEFDAYYDRPYEEDELPMAGFNTDPFFGDRIYENEETFFKEGKLFYRKGSRPRNKFFWD